ncbi:hypothetical protein A4X13_0g1193 [Tilletia indica]|uniref:Uncharacterized protein n=1 Tax=Tilletia indica TaxID=43049 RepID=A0A177TFG9_9BASI|nr:hypothetical protein A4X13_0g1193 [Tilletia indica]
MPTAAKTTAATREGSSGGMVTRRKSAGSLQASTTTPSPAKLKAAASQSLTASPSPAKPDIKIKSSKSKAKIDGSGSKSNGKNIHKHKTKSSTTTTTTTRDLHWHSLADPAIISSEPPLFTPDAAYYFLPTAHSIRIISRHTGATISTLTPPTLPRALRDDFPPHNHRITALALHPSNPLQLLSTSTNGTICVWDYLDARLLRVFFLPLSSSSTTPGSEEAVPGMPITHLVASEQWPDWAFVCARKPKNPRGTSTSHSTILYAVRLSIARASSTTGASSSEPITRISMPSLSAGGSSSEDTDVPVYIPRTRSRLGKIKLIPTAIRLSPRADHLVLVGGTQIHVASLQRTHAEDNMEIDNNAEEDEIIACPDGLAKFTTSERITALAIHPTEKSIATGDETGKIRIFHGLLEDDFLARRRSAEADDEEAEKVAAVASSSSSKNKNNTTTSSSSSTFFGAPSTLLHWHAHAVSTLSYVPLAATGARLLSGGEEATLVLWHIQSGGGGAGRVQKEFVPRLGAPIASVCLAGASTSTSTSSSESGELEEEIVCGLRDGSLVFLNPANLRVLRTFARLKVDANRSLFTTSQQGRIPAPLALQPTNNADGHILVLSSGHPSTIQFYDPVGDGLVDELEVVGSNRVSRPDEAPIEPARVELVAFSPLSPSSSAPVAEWMATLDARRTTTMGSKMGTPRFASEISLKFWMWDGESGRYVLSTSIDRPHGDEGVVSDLSFGWIGAETKKRFENLVCVSTGSDGKMKTWRPVAVSGVEKLGLAKEGGGGKKKLKKKGSSSTTTFHWVARSVFSFRATVPHSVAWAPSPVGVPSSSSSAGLVGVAQGAFVTLWELRPDSNALCVALCAPDLVSSTADEKGSALTEGARHVAFVGRAGRFVVGASEEVVVCWDLLSGSIVWSKSYATPSTAREEKQEDGAAFVIEEVDEEEEDEEPSKSLKRKQQGGGRRRRGTSRVAKILPVPPGSANSAEEMFGILLVDPSKRSSRIELFDLGNLASKANHTSPVAVLELPFVVRTLALAPRVAVERSGSSAGVENGGVGGRNSSNKKKLNAAVRAMSGYMLSSNFEPIQLGWPAGGGDDELADTGTALVRREEEGGANVIRREATEDVVRSRRVRTILDDLLGGGQVFLPETNLSSNKKVLGSGGGGKSAPPAGKGSQMEEVFKLFEAPAHLLPSMSSLFEAFSDAILPKRPSLAVGGKGTAASSRTGEDGEDEGEGSD